MQDFSASQEGFMIYEYFKPLLWTRFRHRKATAVLEAARFRAIADERHGRERSYKAIRAARLQ